MIKLFLLPFPKVYSLTFLRLCLSIQCMRWSDAYQQVLYRSKILHFSLPHMALSKDTQLCLLLRLNPSSYFRIFYGNLALPILMRGCQPIRGAWLQIFHDLGTFWRITQSHKFVVFCFSHIELCHRIYPRPCKDRL